MSQVSVSQSRSDSASSGNKFLTNAPTTRTVKDDAKHWLYAYVDSDSNYPDRVEIVTYDIYGSGIGKYRIDNPNTSGNYTDDHIRIPTGVQLNSVSGITTVIGSTPILTSDVYKYDIKIIDTTSLPSSETRTFNRDFDCNGYDEFNVHFLNELGGFDSFTFDLVSRKTWNKERQTYTAHAGGS